MTKETIIALILITISLVALITLMYMVLIPMTKAQKEEIETRKKLFKELTKYIEQRNNKK